MANWIELTKTWEFASIRSKWCRWRRPDGGNSWAQNVGPIPDGGWLIPNRFQPPNREPVGRHTCHYLDRKRKEKTVPQNYHTKRKEKQPANDGHLRVPSSLIITTIQSAFSVSHRPSKKKKNHYNNQFERFLFFSHRTTHVEQLSGPWPFPSLSQKIETNRKIKRKWQKLLEDLSPLDTKPDKSSW